MQLGGTSGQQIMDSLSNDYIRYGGIGLVLLVVLFFGRFILRSLVNRQVHGIQEASMGFMDLDSMYKKGLISKEEYQEMRQRVAKRELDRIKEADLSRESLNLLSTVAKNPALARVLVEKEITKAKESPGENPSIPTDPIKQAEDFAAAPTEKIKPPTRPVADPEAMRKMFEKDWIVPGDPLSDPRLARKAEPKPMPPPASARGKKKPMDIEDLLAKGLISQEEYNRLAALFDEER